VAGKGSKYGCSHRLQTSFFAKDIMRTHNIIFVDYGARSGREECIVFGARSAAQRAVWVAACAEGKKGLIYRKSKSLIN
jgi:hypothetical protein